VRIYLKTKDCVRIHKLLVTIMIRVMRKFVLMLVLVVNMLYPDSIICDDQVCKELALVNVTDHDGIEIENLVFSQ